MRHLPSHQAGLPVFPEAALEVEYADREALVELLARATLRHLETEHARAKVVVTLEG